jgi:hypothetical protein
MTKFFLDRVLESMSTGVGVYAVILVADLEHTPYYLQTDNWIGYAGAFLDKYPTAQGP